MNKLSEEEIVRGPLAGDTVGVTYYPLRGVLHSPIRLYVPDNPVASILDSLRLRQTSTRHKKPTTGNNTLRIQEKEQN